ILTTTAVLWMMRGRLAADGWTVSWSGALLGVAAFVLWLGLVGHGTSDGNLAAALRALAPASRALWIAARVVGAVVIVPLVEELAFRGYLARRLTAADWESVGLRAISWPALLASSVLFGLLHRDVIAGTIAGALYALAARRRGQL